MKKLQRNLINNKVQFCSFSRFQNVWNQKYFPFGGYYNVIYPKCCTAKNQILGRNYTAQIIYLFIFTLFYVDKIHTNFKCNLKLIAMQKITSMLIKAN